MTDAAVDQAIRTFTVERKYSAGIVDRWLRLSPVDGAALLDLAQELRLGENQLRDFWEWMEEIAQRDGRSLTQVLAADAIASARQRAVGRNDRVKLIRNVLRRMRFPQLAVTEDRLAALVRELGLPLSIHVTLPEFLEGDAVRIEIVADSARSLCDAAAQLLAAAETPACKALFELLAEAP